MSGTFILREGTTWITQSWIHNTVLDAISSELDSSWTELREMLYLADMDRAQFGDLSPFSESEMRAFLQAAERAYANYLDRGPQSFYQPDTYPSFMIIFSKLIALIRVDPRVDVRLPQGEILCGDQRLLVPGVCYELILECSAALVRLQDEGFAQLLTGRRLITDSGTLNIDELEPAHLSLIQEAANWLVSHFGDGLARGWTDREFLPELAIYVRKFHDLVVGGSIQKTFLPED